MNAVDVLQVSLSLAGVLIGGGVWFRLGSLTAWGEAEKRRVDRIDARVTEIENQLWKVRA